VDKSLIRSTEIKADGAGEKKYMTGDDFKGLMDITGRRIPG
jgi:hypothetical protein